MNIKSVNENIGIIILIKCDNMCLIKLYIILQRMLSTIPDYQLADIVSSIVTSSRKEKIDVLNATDLEVRSHSLCFTNLIKKPNLLCTY